MRDWFHGRSLTLAMMAGQLLLLRHRSEQAA